MHEACFASELNTRRISNIRGRRGNELRLEEIVSRHAVGPS